MLNSSQAAEKFKDPAKTAKGEPRAWVDLDQLSTLWFNTGTRCNLSCENCYIESNPKNDRLSFITTSEVVTYLDEIKAEGVGTEEIGFTGGEPFLNPEIIEIIKATLERGFRTLVLTNAYRINRYKDDIKALADQYGDQLVMRVSLDHFSESVHEKERGEGTFAPTLDNLKWFSENNVQYAIAGRSLLGEDMEQVKMGYAELAKTNGFPIRKDDPQSLVVFPEMDPVKDVPEITTSCWEILSKEPSQVMCASSRMVVKRKGEGSPKVLACTLLAYDKQFELGTSLKESKKRVALNHPFCAQFCVLGGSSCS